MPDKTYRAIRVDGDPWIYLDAGQGEQVFSPERSLRFVRHARLFQWGFRCPGAIQLAFALLAEETSPEEAARRYHQFAEEVTSQLPAETWVMYSSVLWGWLETDRERHPLQAEEVQR